MIEKAYPIVGALILTFSGWAQFTGYSGTEVDRIPDVPHSVRNNPGSYRSHYTYFYHHESGK